MCGIAGMILRHGSPDIAALSLAATRLGHRGPDDSGVHRVDSVGLAHTRLSIIDLGGGHQPILDTDGHYALVANGEIYNFVELRAELEAEGCRFRTHSDSETILHVYDRFGVAGLARLNGMFAFALYSKRDRTLILGRDRLGIKPLFYAVLPDRVAFASELKGLLPLLPWVPEISPEALARFFEIGFNSGAETIFQGIRKLEPGTAMVIDASLEPRQITYWSALDIQPREISLEEACEELDPLFDQVLREHMRSDVPYGLFLSGGLDSGILMARLSRWGNAPLRTFSVGYTGTDAGNELADARRVAERFGSDHTELRLDMLDVFRALPLCVRAADDLMYDPACLPTALMAQAAAHELKVVFTGEGGDEVFAGYGRYRRSPVQQLVKQVLHPRTGNYRRGSRWPESLRRSGFGNALEAGRKRLYGPVESAWAETPRGWGFLRRAQYTDLRTELADNLLVKVDRTLMAFGLEGRVPYLDHRIVELGLSLPDRLKVQGRVGKRILRHWAEPLLPQGQSEGKKRGFGVPIGEVLRGDLLERLGVKLAASPLIREWLRPELVPALVALQRRTGTGATGPLLQLMQLALWGRFMLDDPWACPSAEEDPLDWIG